MPAAVETRAGPLAARGDEAPAPPLGQTQQRGSIEMSGSMRDWATSTRPRFRNSLIIVRTHGGEWQRAPARSLDHVWQRSYFYFFFF